MRRNQFLLPIFQTNGGRIMRHVVLLVLGFFFFTGKIFAVPAVVPGVPVVPPDQHKIGVVAAVRGTVKVATPPQVGRIVTSGEAIYLGDVVSTDADSTLQILLLDETVFTIGPNSSIAVDRFVYDPDADTGKVNARVIKGVFRFVTGKIARKKPGDMQVDLPSGTIGIRGTIVQGETDGSRSTVILLGPGTDTNTVHTYGQIVLSNRIGNELKQTSITRAGFGAVIDGIGSAPSDPFKVPADQIAKLTAALQPSQRILAAPQPATPASAAPQGGPLPSDAQKVSPTEQAGQDRAQARGPVLDSGVLGRLFQRFHRETERSAQNAIIGKRILDGVSSFDELRRIQNGVFRYLQPGVPLRDGNGVQIGNYTITIDINFGTRVLNGGPQNGMTGTMSGNAFVFPFAARSFGGGSGPAIFQYNNLVSPCLPAGCTANATIDLQNQGGVIAQVAHHNVTVTNNNAGTTGTGNGVTPPRNPI